MTSGLPAVLADEYFTPTASDLKDAQLTLSARTQALVNAPLQLRAAREAAEKAKRERWPNVSITTTYLCSSARSTVFPQTTIRIRFTDRTQLEKVFPSTDKIRSVYAFVRGCLREDVKPIKFILCKSYLLSYSILILSHIITDQSPPKRDLRVSDPKVRDLSLAELQLAPSSIILLRFEDETLNGIHNIFHIPYTTLKIVAGSDVPAPLVSSVLLQAIDLPTPPDYDNLPSTLNRPSSSTPGGSIAPPAKTGEKKIPKWLKMGLSEHPPSAHSAPHPDNVSPQRNKRNGNIGREYAD